ncbi:MAG: ATPase [Bryobacterales bacterium]|nr:ATPase [Bryobacterales bacterium]
MHLYVGVDGGQSRTRAVVADDSGRLLGRGSGGPCNHATHAEGEARLRKAITESVGGALAQAGLAPSVRLRGACLGMSGGPDDKRRIVSELVAAETVTVKTDAEAALEGAALGQPAAVVIAGTGAICIARGPDGRIARSGGWGYIFGDEGSAFHIVRLAMRNCLAWEEGWGEPEPKDLAKMFLAETGSSGMLEALHRFYTPEWPRRRVAGLALRVDDLAERGDKVSEWILRNCAESLAALADTSIRQVDSADLGLPVYPLGGVFRSRSVMKRFELSCDSLGSPIRQPSHDGAVGALLLAYRADGLEPPQVRVR